MRSEANRLPSFPETPVAVEALRRALPEDFDALVELSRSTQVFTDAELESLASDVADCDPAVDDHLFVAPDAQGRPLGYIQYSPAVITDGTWYVYWIAVAKSTHGQGVGATLLAHAESAIRRSGGRLVVIETSSKPAYDATRRFYLGKGYDLAARIPDYYADGDDKCIFLKRL